MAEKKVVAVIVEGQSDENALGEILKDYFSSEEVQFVVTHGDITSDINTTPANVLKKINELVDRIRETYGYEWKDFLRIIHISDTDGAYVKDCIETGDNETIQYYENKIVCSDIKKVVDRNTRKSSVMDKLAFGVSAIHNKMIPYKLFYNSCNLEHVLYNQLKDFSDDEKEVLSDEFAEKYEGKLEDFIEFISDGSVGVEGSYEDTWKFISKDKHSLERHSNMHLIFE